MTSPPPDRFEFTTVAHRDHRICNPLSDEAVDRALALVELAAGDAVLDVGCGKGEMLIRLAERSAARSVRGVRALGVDLNPHFVEEARRAAAARVPGAAIDFRCADVAEIVAGTVAESVAESGTGTGSGAGAGAGAGAAAAAPPEGPFAAALCVGATHAFGGYRPTLAALSRLVRPGGTIVVGEGFWRRRPDPEYLAFLGTTEDDCTAHEGNVAAGVAAGLTPVHASVASDDDWDRYEDAYAAAVERHVAVDPAAPGAAGMLRRIRAWRAAYLRWGRTTLGFGLYVFRR